MMSHWDLIVVGGGAAGIMAALSARGSLDAKGTIVSPRKGVPHVLLLDGAPKLGAKILISGGGRCNVTNAEVGLADFQTDAPHTLRNVLLEFPVASVLHFFRIRGLPLREEAMGKVFPISNRAADVLALFARELDRAGVVVKTDREVSAVARKGGHWEAVCQNSERFFAKKVIVAAGGKSVPKTGSRGFGIDLAGKLSHEVIPPRPALAPVILGSSHTLVGLHGITTPAILSLVPGDHSIEQISGRKYKAIVRAAGSLLVTHRGISGPAALDVSGACHQALEEKRPVKLLADFWTLCSERSPFAPFADLSKPPGACFPPAERIRPIPLEEFRERFSSEGFGRMPQRLREALLRSAGVSQTEDPSPSVLYEALVHCSLPVTGTEGFEKAEVTSGGIALAELDSRTMESKKARGLFFCGETVNVTGRLGGFNFQWAWSSGFRAGNRVLGFSERA